MDNTQEGLVDLECLLGMPSREVVEGLRTAAAKTRAYIRSLAAGLDDSYINKLVALAALSMARNDPAGQDRMLIASLSKAPTAKVKCGRCDELHSIDGATILAHHALAAILEAVADNYEKRPEAQAAASKREVKVIGGISIEIRGGGAANASGLGSTAAWANEMRQELTDYAVGLGIKADDIQIVISPIGKFADAEELPADYRAKIIDTTKPAIKELSEVYREKESKHSLLDVFREILDR